MPKELKAVWEETTYEVGFGYPISKTSFSKMGLSKTSTSSHCFSSTFETTLELGFYNNKNIYINFRVQQVCIYVSKG